MIKIYKAIALALFLFSDNLLWAQKESATWYFGANAGISFIQHDSINNRKIIGKPKALSDGNINTEEGCTTISDQEGNLLFYSDGITIWNRKHEVMKNGSGLFGHPSSTSSAMAIPYKDNTYYLLTLDHIGEKKGLCYSIIDMTEENGMGAVTQKNVSIKAPLTEKLTAVRHRNNNAVWILSHAIESAEFYAFLLDEAGISIVPVTSVAGLPHKKTEFGTMNYQGYMKVSPDDSKLALAIEEMNVFEVFDFDNETGKVSNPLTLQLHDFSFTYGLEFSPDGSLLYGSAAGTGEVYQFNLKAGSPEDIKSSKTLIGKSTNENWVGALQSGPDKKIYFTLYNTNKLGVIEYPEKIGESCGFKLDAVELTSESKLGLPTFFQSFFSLKQIPKIVVNKDVVLENIYFEYNKADLKPVSFKELDKLAENLKNNISHTILITGHTDSKGNVTHNLELSKKRALAVGDYLNKKGIAKERISTKGVGSSYPIASNNTEEGQRKNRRVEFKISTDKTTLAQSEVISVKEPKKQEAPVKDTVKVETKEDETKKDEVPLKEIVKGEIIVNETKKEEIPVKEDQKPAEKQKEVTEIKNYFSEKTETDKNYILKDVRYETDKEILLESSLPELDKLFKFLEENSAFNLKISGHTDIAGYKVRNIQLSKRRANVVSEYLIQKGIDKSRISIEGLGSQNPIDNSDTEEGRKLNERIEIVLFR